MESFSQKEKYVHCIHKSTVLLFNLLKRLFIHKEVILCMDNSFSINHPLLFILAGIAVLAVALQSVVFLRKAWTRAKEFHRARHRGGYRRDHTLRRAWSASSVAAAFGGRRDHV